MHSGSGIVAKLGADLVGRLCQLGFIVQVASWLGPGEFGSYSLALFFGILAGQLADGGLHLLVNREAVHSKDSLAGSALAAKLRLAALLAPLLGLVIVIFAADPGQGFSLWLIAYSFVIYSFTEFGFSLLRAHQKLHQEALAVLLNRVLLLGGGTLGLAIFGWGLGSVAAAHCVSASLTTLWISGKLRTYISPAQTGSMSQILPLQVWQRALPLGLGLLLSTLSFRMDVPLLAFFHPVEEVGRYSAAYRLFEPALLLPAALVAGCFPRLVRAVDLLPKFVQHSLELLIVLGCLGLATALGLAALSGWIVGWLYEPRYAGSSIILAVLAGAIPFMFLNYGLTHLLIALGHERANTAFFGVALAVNLGANLLLVPITGGIGAAVVTILTELTLCVLCARRVWRLVGPTPKVAC